MGTLIHRESIVASRDNQAPDNHILAPPPLGSTIGVRGAVGVLSLEATITVPPSQRGGEAGQTPILLTLDSVRRPSRLTVTAGCRRSPYRSQSRVNPFPRPHKCRLSSLSEHLGIHRRPTVASRDNREAFLARTHNPHLAPPARAFPA